MEKSILDRITDLFSDGLNREGIIQVLKSMVDTVPSRATPDGERAASREDALAITKIQEAVHWLESAKQLQEQVRASPKD